LEINRIDKMTEDFIPIAKPNMGGEELDAVGKVLQSGMLAQGKVVENFENHFAEYLGVKHAIATSSGTTAIHIALISAGIKAGDEVITTPFTFYATATPILFCNASPVFVDIDPRTFNIDPAKIETAISEKTKALLIVDLYGQPVDRAPIMELVEKHDLILIEDSCQAHGAEFKGKKAGTFGTAGCFSFYPTKNMTTGEGGMLVTNDDEIADRARLLRNHGQRSRYEYVMVGYNFRMTDIAAAIGVEQLKKLDRNNEARINNAKFFNEQLPDIVEVPYVLPDVKHVYHQYTLKTGERDALQDHLKNKNIGSIIYYPQPLHLFDTLKNYPHGDLSNAEDVAKQVISLPVHPGLDEEDLNRIVEGVKSFIL
jgi:dTDP-4-amino-4,6-dideoxygalactose transaminase